MRVLALFILTMSMLYNTKVVATTHDSITSLFQGAEMQLDRIEFNKTRPLRDINGNLKAFKALTELFNELRGFDNELAHDLLKKIEKKDTLSGDELYKIKKSFELLVKFNLKFIEVIEIYEYRKVVMADTYARLDQKNPMVRAHIIYLTSALMMLDHIREIHKIFYAQDGSLRRIIKNTLDDQKKQTLKAINEQIETVSGIVEDKKFLQNVILVRKIETELKEIFKAEPDSLFMLQHFMESESSQAIAQNVTSFKLENFQLADSIIIFFNQLTNTLSEVFGNIAGSIHWRKGYLFNSPDAKELLLSDLRPMDLLLEKSPFVLTDKFIPGHFGHVAIYLGTREQLEKIGMWDHPDLIEYHDEIESGKVILEAIRSGVRLSTIDSFMNIDEVTVVRKEDALSTPGLVYEQIKRGIDQIGKAYDFNFDISTLDKIVCSELIYIVYGNVHWPTRYRLGRATITPDDLAEVLFYKNSRFKVKNYLLSTKRHRIEVSNAQTLAGNFDYELRFEDGSPMNDERDPRNSYWKKETKCYNVTSIPESRRGDTDEQLPITEKVCRTTYKEFYYEEWGL